MKNGSLLEAAIVPVVAMFACAACSISPAKPTMDGTDAATPSGTGGAAQMDSGHADGSSEAAASPASDAQDAPASFDASQPGDAASGSTDAAEQGDSGLPAVVLGDPRVAAALQQASAAGHPILVHTERQPPTIAGYYVKPETDGRFVATGNGVGIGNRIYAFEARINVGRDDAVSLAYVSFYQGAIVDVNVQTGVVLRGAGDELTLYTKFQNQCPAPSDFGTDGYSITSARVDPATGSLLSVRQLSVTIATRGALTPECADQLIGDTETVGGWGELEISSYQRVHASDLVYMCVDGDAGYIENETWKSEAGMCTCTVDYEVQCH